MSTIENPAIDVECGGCGHEWKTPARECPCGDAENCEQHGPVLTEGTLVQCPKCGDLSLWTVGDDNGNWAWVSDPAVERELQRLNHNVEAITANRAEALQQAEASCALARELARENEKLRQEKATLHEAMQESRDRLTAALWFVVAESNARDIGVRINAAITRDEEQLNAALKVTP